MWLAGTRPSSTLGLGSLEVRIDDSARLFLCARCFVQVRLCSRCDRGQRYCTRTCSSLARDAAQHEAASRYQRSRGGRMAHAARSRRWRIRHHRIDPLETTQVRADANIVTHQGSPGSPADAPLLAWTSDHAEASLTGDPDPSAAKAVARSTGPTCRRCGAALAPWVRQGFLRRQLRVRAARHDHSP